MAADPRQQRVFRATLAGALLPGAGHFLLGRKRAGGVFFLAAAAALAMILLHALQGLVFFDAKLGSFLLGHLLRSAILLHAYSVLDAYLLGVDPDGGWAPRRRRLAVILNVLLPGLGYLYIGAWVRAVIGVALDVVFLYFAQATHHPYLDPIFVAMLAIMAVAVYRQVRIQETSGGRDMMAAAERVRQAPTPAPEMVQSAQVVVLVVTVFTLVALGLVVQARLLPSEITGLKEGDISYEERGTGVDFKVRSLGLSMTAEGDGWSAAMETDGSLFRAVHKGEAELKVGIQLIPAFMDTDRFLLKLQRVYEEIGYKHIKSKDLDLNGSAARQMFFTGKFTHSEQDFWIVTVPHGRLAYVIGLKCRKASCPAVSQELERTRDSFSLSN